MSQVSVGSYNCCPRPGQGQAELKPRAAAQAFQFNPHAHNFVPRPACATESGAFRSSLLSVPPEVRSLLQLSGHSLNLPNRATVPYGAVRDKGTRHVGMVMHIWAVPSSLDLSVQG